MMRLDHYQLLRLARLSNLLIRNPENMHKRILFVAFLALITAGLFGQQQGFEGYMEYGDNASQKDDHYNAYQYYATAIEFLACVVDIDTCSKV